MSLSYHCVDSFSSAEQIKKDVINKAGPEGRRTKRRCDESRNDPRHESADLQGEEKASEPQCVPDTVNRKVFARSGSTHKKKKLKKKKKDLSANHFYRESRDIQLDLLRMTHDVIFVDIPLILLYLVLFLVMSGMGRAKWQSQECATVKTSIADTSRHSGLTNIPDTNNEQGHRDQHNANAIDINSEQGLRDQNNANVIDTHKPQSSALTPNQHAKDYIVLILEKDYIHYIKLILVVLVFSTIEYANV